MNTPEQIINELNEKEITSYLSETRHHANGEYTHSTFEVIFWYNDIAWMTEEGYDELVQDVAKIVGTTPTKTYSRADRLRVKLSLTALPPDFKEVVDVITQLKPEPENHELQS